MERVLSKRLIVFIVLLISSNSIVSAQTIVDSINASDVPDSGSNYGATEAGWLYTPSESYILTEIGTEFGNSSSQIVTAEIFSTSVIAGTIPPISIDQAPLASGTLTPSGLTFSFATLNSQVEITAGTQYLIAFQNIEGLGVNQSFTPATDLPVYYDFNTPQNNAFDHYFFLANNGNNQPIIKFAGTVVPEPCGWTLILLGLGMLAVRKLRTVFSVHALDA